MLFRDPRQLPPEYDLELDTTVQVCAEFIAAAVVDCGPRRTPDDPGKWTRFAEMRALDLIDREIAKRRDDIDYAGSMSIAEREYDVAFDRLRRDVEQLLRTAVAVAEEQGRDPHAVLADHVNVVRDYAEFIGSRIRIWIHPDAGI